MADQLDWRKSSDRRGDENELTPRGLSRDMVMNSLVLFTVTSLAVVWFRSFANLAQDREGHLTTSSRLSLIALHSYIDANFNWRNGSKANVKMPSSFSLVRSSCSD
jgi:hypothetical protein